MRALRAPLCALLLWATFAAVAQETIPSDPVAGEPFVVIGSASFAPATTYNGSMYLACRVSGTTVTVSGGSISVLANVSGAGYSYYPSDWTCPFTALVPGLAAGTYDTALGVPPTIGGITRMGLSAQHVTVGPAPPAAEPSYRGLDGNWFDPSRPGWGTNLVQGDSGALFAVWLTYRPFDQRSGDGGQPLWLVMPSGRWITSSTFRGILYSARGPVMGASFDPTAVQPAAIGAATLAFSSPTDAVFDATILWSGTGVLIPVHASLKRFDF